MLDFCGEHNITSDIELIDMQDINTKLMIVLQVMIYRFVIDMKSLNKKQFFIRKQHLKVILDAVLLCRQTDKLSSISFSQKMTQILSHSLARQCLQRYLSDALPFTPYLLYGEYFRHGSNREGQNIHELIIPII
jgi:hypothetical protein